MKINKNVMMLACGLTALTVLFSCKKKDDNSPSSGKKAKITLTLSSDFKKAEGDYFDVTLAASKTNGSTVDWKVDGVLVKGASLNLGTDNFNGGKTIVIESADSFYAGALNIGGFEFGATPFTVTYKVEVDGKVINEGSERIVKDRDPIFAKTTQL
ncbi:hypothetical protein [Pedobacter frigoris]|uniref:Uncharacterized protein n=1 Tax=Pedobacter frigoris TaxID=2571272 RepID=A0A4U1CT12_9SPHI|nr:hypothetical protein [Pedobacter frigoris]TKC09069.1 hypothetical protein FA047_02945 [Pedobacter frigoris]